MTEAGMLVGEFRRPRQMLGDQEYDGHLSIHDDKMAEDLGFAGAPIEGPNRARFRDCPVSRDLGAHEAELETPKDFPERIDGHETQTIRQIRACSI